MKARCPLRAPLLFVGGFRAWLDCSISFLIQVADVAFDTVFSTRKNVEESLRERMPAQLRDRVRPFSVSKLGAWSAIEAATKQPLTCEVLPQPDSVQYGLRRERIHSASDFSSAVFGVPCGMRSQLARCADRGFPGTCRPDELPRTCCSHVCCCLPPASP